MKTVIALALLALSFTVHAANGSQNSQSEDDVRIFTSGLVIIGGR